MRAASVCVGGTLRLVHHSSLTITVIVARFAQQRSDSKLAGSGGTPPTRRPPARSLAPGDSYLGDWLRGWCAQLRAPPRPARLGCPLLLRGGGGRGQHCPRNSGGAGGEARRRGVRRGGGKRETRFSVPLWTLLRIPLPPHPPTPFFFFGMLGSCFIAFLFWERL